MKQLEAISEQKHVLRMGGRGKEARNPHLFKWPDTQLSSLEVFFNNFTLGLFYNKGVCILISHYRTNLYKNLQLHQT